MKKNKRLIALLTSMVVLLSLCCLFSAVTFADDGCNGDLGPHAEDAIYNSPAYQAAFDKWRRQQNNTLAPRAGGSRQLNVTNYQQVNTSACGPACVYQILEYLGANTESHTSIANAMTNYGQQGVGLSVLISYMNSRIASNQYIACTTSNAQFITRLINSIDKNRPVICHVNPHTLYSSLPSNGHYVVATGYSWGMSGSQTEGSVTYNEVHHNNNYYGTYTISFTKMENAINARSGYYAAA